MYLGIQREVMNYDVVVVGAGPSGLATAIHIKQLSLAQKIDLSVAILEKGSSVGAHIISGCVMDPKGLSELIPDWENLGFPVKTKVSSELMLFLSATSKYKLPLPHEWSNEGNYIISLGLLCQRLAAYAEDIGVEIYPGFAAMSPVIENNRVVGVLTGDMGIGRNGIPTSNYQAGVEIRAKQIVLAEGCRGSLAKQIIRYFNLDSDSAAQTYGLGIKEIWQIEPNKHNEGSVAHCIGYPLNGNAYGGGFIYHQSNNLLSIGLVTALDYANPYLSPYEEFQKFKLHPYIQKLLEGGKRIEYGARTVTEGGIQALPKLTFPGGLIVGDSAGFLNVARIKGVHNAIKSGMLAAQAIMNDTQQAETVKYTDLIHNSWLYHDLYKVRNIRPGFNLGLYFGLLYAAVDYYLLRGKAPWTFKIKTRDNQSLEKKSFSKPFNYPKPDGVVTFDRNSSLLLSNISHDENQPCHLYLKDKAVAIKINLRKYDSPETRYCPAGVYEIIYHKSVPEMHINAQNCVHCKACDIKDPTQNINWLPPEGGSGPQYSEM